MMMAVENEEPRARCQRQEQKRRAEDFHHERNHQHNAENFHRAITEGPVMAIAPARVAIGIVFRTEGFARGIAHFFLEGAAARAPLIAPCPPIVAAALPGFEFGAVIAAAIIDRKILANSNTDLAHNRIPPE